MRDLADQLRDGVLNAPLPDETLVDAQRGVGYLARRDVVGFAPADEAGEAAIARKLDDRACQIVPGAGRRGLVPPSR
jgi:hypothetical protein